MNAHSLPLKHRTAHLPTQVPPRAIATPPPGGSAAKTTDRDTRTSGLSRTLENQFAVQAKDPQRFHALMRGVYGDGYDQANAEQLRTQALAGDFSWLPPVKLLPADQLQGALGAYDAASGTVYVNADIAASDPELAASTYVEEAGAHLDTLLNRSDSIGDEGELFRRVLAGEKLSIEDVREIQAEDDHSTITVDGRGVAVEFWNPLASIQKVAKRVGGVFEKIGTEVKDAVKDVGAALKSGYERLSRAGGEAWNTLSSGVRGMTVSFVKNLFKGKFGEAFVILFDGFEKVVFGMPRKVAGMVVDGARDVAKAFAHLLPQFLGKPIRTGLDQATEGLNIVGRALLGIPLKPFRAIKRPVGEFLIQTDRTIRSIAQGNVRRGFDDFGRMLKGLPKGVWIELTAPLDDPHSEITRA